MKEYFIAGVVRDDKGRDFHFHSTVAADLNQIGLNDLAWSIIEHDYPRLSINDVTIKITAFNNIER